MGLSTDQLVHTHRRPEHTGERRCWPCTVANAVLVLGAALAVARRRRLAALPVLLVGTALVYLRGYVLPGTPWFAPRLVAPLPLPYDPFDHDVPGREPPGEAIAEPGTGTEPGEDGRTGEGTPSPVSEPDALGDAAEPGGEEVLSALVESGVVVVDRERVAPDPGFREEWEAETADLAELDTEALADAVHEVARADEADAVSGERGEWVVLGDGSVGIAGRTWLSRPIAVAEAGAVRALEDRGLDRPTRLAAAGALRTFLETCPDCGAALEETTTAAACCGGPKEEPADVLYCPDCDARLFTFGD